MKKLTLIPILLVANASAAVISFNFSASISGTSTVYDGTNATGTVTYDDAVVMAGAPAEFFAPDASITVSAFGQTFTAADDLEAGAFPILTLSPTDELAFTFVVAEAGGTNPTLITEPRVVGFQIDLAPVATGGTDYPAIITVTTNSVPEPSTGLMILGVIALGLRRRR